MVKVLYAGKTLSFEKKEFIEYGVVDESGFNDADVVIFSREPPGEVVFPDLENGWVYSPVLSFRRFLTEVDATLRMTPNGIYKTIDFKVLNEVDARKLAEEIEKRLKIIREKLEKGESIEGERTFTHRNLMFTFMKVTPPKDQKEVIDIISFIASLVTSARKRVLLATPVLIELMNENGDTEYLYVTLPRILHILLNAPDLIEAVLLIEEERYKLPLLYVKSVIINDLKDVRTQKNNVEILKTILTSGEALLV